MRPASTSLLNITARFDVLILVDLALMSALWIATCFVIDPFGQFPLIDDWAFSRDVYHLLTTGQYSIVGWGPESLVSHIVLGTLASLPAGFSFTTLRFTCIVSGLLGVFGVYVLVRDLSEPRLVCLIAALTLAFFPGYLLVSYTFMTDIPFAAMIIWASVFFARNLRGGSDRELVIGTILALVATLSRQVGLAVPLAFFSLLAFRKQDWTFRTVTRAAGPLVICLLALISYSLWMKVTHRVPTLNGNFTAPSFWNTKGLQALLFNASLSIYFVPIYLGLFLSTLLSLCWHRIFGGGVARLMAILSDRTAIKICATLIILMVGAGCVLCWRDIDLFLPMYSRGNVLERFGFGPLSLRDIDTLGLYDHVGSVPNVFWIVITVIGLAGAFLLVVWVGVHGRELFKRPLQKSGPISHDQTVGLFMILCALFYWAPFLLWGYFDRHLCVLIPWVLAAVLAASEKMYAATLSIRSKSLWVSLVLLLVWGGISTSGTRDYLNLNRIRWKAIRDLVANQHAELKDIDGGAEFNALYFFDPKKGDWSVGDTYLIAFGLVPGYSPLREYEYYNWFPPHTQKILAMQKGECFSGGCKSTIR